MTGRVKSIGDVAFVETSFEEGSIVSPRPTPAMPNCFQERPLHPVSAVQLECGEAVYNVDGLRVVSGVALSGTGVRAAASSYKTLGTWSLA